MLRVHLAELRDSWSAWLGVAIAFIVYDRVMTSQQVEVVENSRSAQVFERMRSQMDQQIPDDAPGWIVSRYEQMVAGCTAAATPSAQQTPPAAD